MKASHGVPFDSLNRRRISTLHIPLAHSCFTLLYVFLGIAHLQEYCRVCKERWYLEKRIWKTTYIHCQDDDVGVFVQCERADFPPREDGISR